MADRALRIRDGAPLDGGARPGVVYGVDRRADLRAALYFMRHRREVSVLGGAIFGDRICDAHAAGLYGGLLLRVRLFPGRQMATRGLAGCLQKARALLRAVPGNRTGAVVDELDSLRFAHRIWPHLPGRRRAGAYSEIRSF